MAANGPPMDAPDKGDGKATKAVPSMSSEDAARRFSEIKAMSRDEQAKCVGELHDMALLRSKIGREAAELLVSIDGMSTRREEVERDAGDRVLVAQVPDEHGVADSAEKPADDIRAEMAGRKPRPRGRSKAAREAAAAKGKAKDADKVPETEKPAAKDMDKSDSKPKVEAKDTGKAPRKPAAKPVTKPAPREEREPHGGITKASFVWIKAITRLVIVALLRRPAPFMQVIRADLGVAVDKERDGSAAIVAYMDDGRRFEIVLPSMTVDHVANALELILPGETGMGTGVEFNDVMDVKITGHPGRRSPRPTSRNDDERDSAPTPTRTSGRRSARQPDDSDGSARKPSFSTPTLPGSTRQAPRAPADERADRPSPKGTAASANDESADRAPTPSRVASPPQSRSPRFTDEDVAHVGRTVVRFVEGQEGSFEWGIPLVDELLADGVKVADAKYDPRTGFLRSKLSFEQLLPAVVATYAGEHPLALLVKDGVFRISFLDGFANARGADGSVRILPISVTIAKQGVTPEAIAEAREDYRAWQARHEADEKRRVENAARREQEQGAAMTRRNAAMTRWQTAFGKALSGAKEAVGAVEIPVLPNGAGVDFQAVKKGMGGSCSVKSEACQGALKVRVMTAFGRAWSVCEACMAGFQDARNARILSRLEQGRTAMKFATALGPDDFIDDWPDRTQEEILGTRIQPMRDGSWPSWVPATPEEARERLLEQGPYVQADPRSWGVDALSGEFAIALPFVAVVQTANALGGTDYLAYPVTEGSADLLRKVTGVPEGKPVKWGEDGDVLYLIDRNGCLARRPSLEGERKHVDRIVEQNVHEKFDMSEAEREAEKAKREAKAEERRRRRREVFDLLLTALGWYQSDTHLALQREAAGDDADTDGDDKPKPPKKKGGGGKDKAERSAADRERTAATHAGGKKGLKGKDNTAKRKKSGGGDSPNDPEVTARLKDEARLAAAAGGTVLPEGLKGPDRTRTTRGSAVSKKKEEGKGKKK